MCDSLLIASDVVLDEVSSSEISPLSRKPIFFVKNADDQLRKWAVHRLKKANLYYLGAYTGCSCGFSFGTGSGTEEENKLGKISVHYLSQYFESAVKVSDIEVYYGSDIGSSEAFVETSLDFFKASSFDLESGSFLYLRRDAKIDK